MTTTKSYLAGLGMTGIVIGSILVLLAVGTGLVAFEGARDVAGGRAPLERVVVRKDARAGGERRRKEPDDTVPPTASARFPLVAPAAVSRRSTGATGGADAAGGGGA